MEFEPAQHRLGSRHRLSCAAMLLALGTGATAFAQTPAINLGQGMQLRFENASSYENGHNVGQTKLLMNVFLDTNTSGPFVLTLEQGGRVLATGSCQADPVVYSGEAQDGQGFLRECVTNPIHAADIRTNAPVDVALAIVNDATDVRTELYRGTFPVIGFFDWTGMENNQPFHIEQRGLRMDSMYGVGYVRQYMADLVQFTYVTTQNSHEFNRDSSMRCKVGSGEWTAYETSPVVQNEQTIRNRVNDGSTIHEDGNETIVTQWVSFDAHMPIAVQGRAHRPSAGTSMDGAWTCEFRTGGAGTRVVQREFRFNVQNGYIQPHAIESQIRPGTGTVLTAIGFSPQAMPMIIDPAIVNTTILGRRLTGATAPVVAGMPARAVQPALSVARSAGARSGGGGRRH